MIIIKDILKTKDLKKKSNAVNIVNSMKSEVNKNKDVSNITLLNDNIKNIIEFDDFESIFNDPFFK